MKIYAIIVPALTLLLVGCSSSNDGVIYGTWIVSGDAEVCPPGMSCKHVENIADGKKIRFTKNYLYRYNLTPIKVIKYIRKDDHHWDVILDYSGYQETMHATVDGNHLKYVINDIVIKAVR
jgi:hypothetical protein